MKRKSLLIVIFVFQVLIGNAQISGNDQSDTLKHAIYFGYGTATTPALAYATAALISSMLPLPIFGVNQYETKFSGAFFIGYQYAVSQRVSLGATFAYEKSNTKEFSGSFIYTGHYYTVLAGTKCKYNLNRKISLYGRADFGALIYSFDSKGENLGSYSISPSNFAFQISPLCVRVGRKFGGYCELGIGNIGIINFGCDYRF